MSFIQFEIWGVLDGREELIECVATLREATILAEDAREFNDEVYIIQDEDGVDLVEVRRFKGL
jgi:hypothetical protein